MMGSWSTPPLSPRWTSLVTSWRMSWPTCSIPTGKTQARMTTRRWTGSPPSWLRCCSPSHLTTHGRWWRFWPHQEEGLRPLAETARLVGCAPGWVGPALKGEMHEGHDVLVVTDHVVDCRLHGVTGRSAIATSPGEPAVATETRSERVVPGLRSPS